jgi:hypothetical protein
VDFVLKLGPRESRSSSLRHFWARNRLVLSGRFRQPAGLALKRDSKNSLLMRLDLRFF